MIHQQQQQQVQSQNIEYFTGNNFGDKVSFTVGASYLTGLILGIGQGLKNGIPKSIKMPKKLIMNNFFNSLGKSTSKFGNAFAGAGLMYYLIGSTLEYYTSLQKNIICGTITGMLYKSTLGVIPCLFGGFLGATILGSFTLLVQEGNRKGYVAFQMKF